MNETSRLGSGGHRIREARANRRTTYVSALGSLPALGSVLIGGVLAGCAPGGNEGDFVKACMTGPGQHNTAGICRCAAHEANASLPRPQFDAMVLDMQGKKREAERSLGEMSFDQRATFAMKQFEIIGKCVGNGPSQ